MSDIASIPISELPDPLPQGAIILDVREPDEWAHGHIDGATHIPLQQVPQRLTEVPEVGEGEHLYVICKLGGRSAQATAWLQAQGVSAVNLDGGMQAWERAGRPMVADSGEPTVV